jgi:hypothetical protein
MSQDAIQARIQRASMVQQKYADQLMRIPGVVGVAVGFATQKGNPTQEIALIVMVQKKIPENQIIDTRMVLPRSLDGVRVDVQETGIFTAH